jgi:hypothetical protein
MSKLFQENWHEIGHASARLMEHQGGFASKLAALYYAADLKNAKRLFLAFEELFSQSTDSTLSSKNKEPSVEKDAYKSELAPIHYVIYSPNESASNSGAGYWSNNDGWVDDAGNLTFFSEAERQEFELPLSIGCDAKWVPVEITGAHIALAGNITPKKDQIISFVSFGAYDDAELGLDSFGQSDENTCYYTTYAEFVEKFRSNKPLYDDWLIAEVRVVYFNRIDKGLEPKNIPQLFSDLYEALVAQGDVKSEEAIGFVARAQAVFRGDLSSEDSLPHDGDPHPKVVEVLEGCVNQMQQAQKMFEDDIEFGEALSKAENVLSDLNKRGSTHKSSIIVEYWCSKRYNRQNEESSAQFEMDVIDNRLSSGQLDVGIAPLGGNIDDNLTVMLEINRLPESDDDLPCAHISIGDYAWLNVYQRNQELVLQLGDDSLRLENASIPRGYEINGVPQYEQVILIK